MAYDLEEIEYSQRIFYYLIKNKELSENLDKELYREYSENENVANLVNNQAKYSSSTIGKYGSVIYMIPDVDNYVFGFSKNELKRSICHSKATDKDYYIAQFVILTLLTEFYDGQGSSSKAREFMRLGNLQNLIAEKLEEGSKREEESESENRIGKFAYSNMLEAYNSLRSEDGSTKRTTKEGFFHHIFRFLEGQGLIEYVKEDEMITTTEKLDNFMNWNLLNENNYDKLQRIMDLDRSDYEQDK